MLIRSDSHHLHDHLALQLTSEPEPQLTTRSNDIRWISSSNISYLSHVTHNMAKILLNLSTLGQQHQLLWWHLLREDQGQTKRRNKYSQTAGYDAALGSQTHILNCPQLCGDIIEVNKVAEHSDRGGVKNKATKKKKVMMAVKTDESGWRQGSGGGGERRMLSVCAHKCVGSK